MISHCIEAHASSNAEFTRLKEPVSETEKKIDFLASISDLKLDMAKYHVLGIFKLNESFDYFQ